MNTKTLPRAPFCHNNKLQNRRSTFRVKSSASDHNNFLNEATVAGIASISNIVAPAFIGVTTGTIGFNIAEIAELPEPIQYINGISFAAVGVIVKSVYDEWQRREKAASKRIRIVLDAEERQEISLAIEELVRLSNNDISQLSLNLCKSLGKDGVTVLVISNTGRIIDLELQAKLSPALRPCLETVSEIRLVDK